MKNIFAILALATLTACNATPEEQAFDLDRIQKQLPEGCEIHYAGKVRTVDSERESRIFYTKCGEVTTTSESHEEQSGKTSVTTTNATVNGIE